MRTVTLSTMLALSLAVLSFSTPAISSPAEKAAQNSAQASAKPAKKATRKAVVRTSAQQQTAVWSRQHDMSVYSQSASVDSASRQPARKRTAVRERAVLSSYAYTTQ